MRRALGAVVAVALCIPAMTAGAATSEENVRDDFGSVTYAGNDGSLDWSGSWAEGGDDGDPANGKIQITSGGCSNNTCLRMGASAAGGALEPMDIKRRANLSEFSNATLSFDLVLDPIGTSTDRTFYIEVRGKGSGWKVLDSYSLLTQSGSFSKSYNVSNYAGSDFELRFRLSGLLGGDNVYVDRVDVRGAVPVTTTTSTTSTTSTTATTSTTSTTQPETSEPSPSRPPATTPTTTGSPTTSSTAPFDTRTTRPDLPFDDSTPTTVGRDESPGDGAGGAGQSLGPPPGSGLRVSALGVMADFRTGSMGDMATEQIEVLGANLEADFSLAVETFGRAKIWMAILSLLVAAAAVSGMDWRRSRSTSTRR